MTSTSMARLCRTNTNYGKCSFGCEQLDFQSMTTKSFTKSELKKRVNYPVQKRNERMKVIRGKVASTIKKKLRKQFG
jgi:hypothetical protein